MAHLEAFMSDFISQYECSSVYVVSDNARVQQQQQQQQQLAPSSPVPPPRLVDYNRTTRWDSVGAIHVAMGPPIRQMSDVEFHSDRELRRREY